MRNLGWRNSSWAAVLCCPVLVYGADTLESVQKNIIESSKKLTSLQFDMTTSSNFSGPGHEFTQNGKGRYEYLKKGDKMLFRVDSKDKTVTKMGDQVETQESTSTMIFDGDYFYTTSESNGQKSAVKMRPQSGWVADQAYFNTMKETYDMKLLPDDTLDGRSVYVIEARAKSAPQGMAPAIMTLWFDKETGMSIKTEVKDESGKVTSTSMFSNMKVGSGISESRFKFELPPGVELTDLTQMDQETGYEQGNGAAEEGDQEQAAEDTDDKGGDEGNDEKAEEEPKAKESSKGGVLGKLKKKFP